MFYGDPTSFPELSVKLLAPGIQSIETAENNQEKLALNLAIV